jgi:hypothetical protein
MVDVKICFAAYIYIGELIRSISKKIEYGDDRAVCRVLERYYAPRNLARL